MWYLLLRSIHTHKLNCLLCLCSIRRLVSVFPQMFRPLRSNLQVRPCFAHLKLYSPLKYSQNLYHTLSFILILWRPVLSILLNLECLESKFFFFSLLKSTTCHSYHVINRSIINTADIHWALTMCWWQYYSKCFTYKFFFSWTKRRKKTCM